MYPKFIRQKRLSASLRLPSKDQREYFLQNVEKLIKKNFNVLAKSELSTEEKEELANFFLFILNILDIENAKLSYEKIDIEKKKGSRRIISET